jgi:hypothetical protein
VVIYLRGSMTRIYKEIETDTEKNNLGNGEEIYNFLINKSTVGKEFIESIKNKDYLKMCLLSCRLGKIGYSETEIQSFLKYIFHTRGV